MKACKISKCKKGNVGGDNDNYDGNGDHDANAAAAAAEDGDQHANAEANTVVVVAGVVVVGVGKEDPRAAGRPAAAAASPQRARRLSLGQSPIRMCPPYQHRRLK